MSTESERNDLPPWMRAEDDASEEAPSTPPQPEPPEPPAAEPELPPWLAGLDEDLTGTAPTSEPEIRIPGVSHEFLASGDELPDTLDTDQTYDAWAEQLYEENRVRDPEEDVPDLLSAIEPDAPESPAERPSTGELPDWFLGLEEIDTSDAPEWFTKSTSAPPPPAPAVTDPESGVPPWMADMAAEDQPPSDELPTFEPLSDEPAGADEETPDLSWFSEADFNDTPIPTPDEYAQPVDDFMSALGAAPLADDDFALSEWHGEAPELPDDLPVAEPEPEAIDQPAAEDFFSEPAAERAEALLEEIEDPELSWFLHQNDEPQAEVPPVPSGDDLPIPARADDQIPDPDMDFLQAQDKPDSGSSSWLQELQGILTSASRALRDEPASSAAEPPPPADAAAHHYGIHDPRYPFDWIDAGAAEEEAAEQEPEGPGWLADVQPLTDEDADGALEQADDEADQAFDPFFEIAPPTQPAPSLLTGKLGTSILRGAGEPAAQPDASLEGPEADIGPDLPTLEDDEAVFTLYEADQAPPDDSDDEDLFAHPGAERTVIADDSTADWDSAVQARAALYGGSQASDQQPTEAEESAPEQAPDLFAAFDAPDSDEAWPFDQPADAPTEQDADDLAPQMAAPGDEPIETDWLTDDLFGEDEGPVVETFTTPSMRPPAEQPDEAQADDEDSDLFALLESDPNANVLPITDELLRQQQAEAKAAFVDEDAQAVFEDAPAAEWEDESPWDQAEAEADELPDEALLYGAVASGGAPAADAADPDQGLIEDAPDLFGDFDLEEPEQAPDLFDYDEQLAAPAASAVEQTSEDEEPDMDWLRQAVPPAAAAGVAALFDQEAEDELPEPDLFSDFGIGAPAASAEAADQGDANDAAADEDDFFRSFERKAPQAPDPNAEPDWLQGIDSSDVSEPEPPRPAAKRPAAESQAQPSSDLDFSDIDRYLASLAAQEMALTPPTSSAAEDDIDLDEFFAETPFTPEPSSPSRSAEPPLEPTVSSEWLKEIQASVGEVSPTAMVRQRKDRPVDNLPDRLQKLRQKSSALPSDQQAAQEDALTGVLPGGGTALSPAPLRPSGPAMAPSIALTDEQARKIALLQTLVASEGEATAAARGSQVGAETRVKPQAQGRRGVPIFRWLAVLLLALAVILPFFFGQLRVGDLPPAAFAADSPQAAVFAAVDELEPDALALVAIEYGPSAAAELDSAADALLRHILLRGARPVLVGGNPVGLLRAGNLIDAINRDQAFLTQIDAGGPLQAKLDYFVVRYLPGSVLGLRAFSEDTAALLLTDINGQATGLQVNSLRDFALIVVIAESAEDLRAYAEQVAPLAGAPLIAAVNYAAAPLVEPYVGAQIAEGSSGLRGLLVGYSDAYTYGVMLGGADAVARGGPRPTIVPPTLVPATPIPTATPEVTATATARPTQTPSPSPTPLPEAVVIAAQPINVRSGPGTNNAVVAALPRGTRVQVLGSNDAGDWLNIRFGDDSEGWVSASLMRLEDAEQSSTQKQPRLLKPAAQEATPEAAPVTSEPAAAGVGFPFTTGYRDERWYAMTLGTITAALIVLAGAAFNVARSLLRRRRS